MTIWKFPLAVTDVQDVPMPADAQVASVQLQGGQLMAWALVSPDAPIVNRRFRVIGTGNPVPDVAMTYRGSVQMGLFVWHVFEEHS